MKVAKTVANQIYERGRQKFHLEFSYNRNGENAFLRNVRKTYYPTRCKNSLNYHMRYKYIVESYCVHIQCE